MGSRAKIYIECWCQAFMYVIFPNHDWYYQISHFLASYPPPSFSFNARCFDDYPSVAFDRPLSYLYTLVGGHRCQRRLCEKSIPFWEANKRGSCTNMAWVARLGNFWDGIKISSSQIGQVQFLIYDFRIRQVSHSQKGKTWGQRNLKRVRSTWMSLLSDFKKRKIDGSVFDEKCSKWAFWVLSDKP